MSVLCDKDLDYGIVCTGMIYGSLIVMEDGLILYGVCADKVYEYVPIMNE